MKLNSERESEEREISEEEKKRRVDSFFLFLVLTWTLVLSPMGNPRSESIVKILLEFDESCQSVLSNLEKGRRKKAWELHTDSEGKGKRKNVCKRRLNSKFQFFCTIRKKEEWKKRNEVRMETANIVYVMEMVRKKKRRRRVLTLVPYVLIV